MPADARGAPPELLERIRSKLSAAFAPASVEIRDDTARHAGHREAGGRCHLRLRIVSPRFEGRSNLARHREVYRALAEELAGPVHALSLRAETPEETAASP